MEEVDAIIDKTGQTVFAEIQGYVSNRKLIIFYYNGNQIKYIHSAQIAKKSTNVYKFLTNYIQYR